MDVGGYGINIKLAPTDVGGYGIGGYGIGGYGCPAQTHRLDRVGAKGPQRRGPEQWGASNAAQHAVDLDVGLRPAQRATTHQPAPDDAAVPGGQSMRRLGVEVAGTGNPGCAPAAVVVLSCTG